MIRKLQFLKTAVLSAFLLGGANLAWGDNTVTVTVGETSTYYATLRAAIEANAFKDPSGNIEVSISADQSLGDKVISWEPTANTNYTLTIKATTDITIKGPNASRWFTAKNNGANLIVGDGVNEITLDGEYSGGTTKQRTQAVALHNNTSANITFNKVTFKNFNLNNAVNMIVGEKGAGIITLQDVTISNCVNPKDAYIDNLCTQNDKVLLKGTFTIDNESSGTEFKTTFENTSNRGRIKVDDSNFTATRVLKIKYTNMPTAIGSGPVVVRTQNTTANILNYFDLDEDEYGFYMTGNDLKITQAYKLTVGAAKAATLVLPFESKIPSGVSCYTLHYTTGNSAATKTLVETTLPANTPVLINAEEGSYKFVSTATSGDFATGSEAVTFGALTGVYSETTVPSESYILYNGTSGLGFYKSDGSTNTVEAYRAYLTADGAGSRTFIGFDDETTGIDSVVKQDTKTADNVYYNLSGQRVANPSKGLYIVNGKKVIIK